MSANRPRVLLIKPILPYPPDQGTKVVSFDLIRTLQREFDVTVLNCTACKVTYYYESR